MPNVGIVNRKEGELQKYKNILSGWGKRYFRLERSYLHYFETKHSHEPIATITRGEISKVKPSTAFPGRDNVFEIIQKSGFVWYCQTNTTEEMVEWIQALSTVPIVLDPSKYPMKAAEQQPQPSINQDFHDENQPPASHVTDSPYRNLIDQAHHTAYTFNTSHDCQHHREHQNHLNSPPPPYSPDENYPFNPSSSFQTNPPDYKP